MATKKKATKKKPAKKKASKRRVGERLAAAARNHTRSPVAQTLDRIATDEAIIVQLKSMASALNTTMQVVITQLSANTRVLQAYCEGVDAIIAKWTAPATAPQNAEYGGKEEASGEEEDIGEALARRSLEEGEEEAQIRSALEGLDKVKASAKAHGFTTA